MDDRKVLNFNSKPYHCPITSILFMTDSFNVTRAQEAMLKLSKEIIFKKYWDYKRRAYRVLHTNNYLKRHHKPMKRRGV